jgi:hypothetical protein
MDVILRNKTEVLALIDDLRSRGAAHIKLDGLEVQFPFINTASAPVEKDPEQLVVVPKGEELEALLYKETLAL